MYTGTRNGPPIAALSHPGAFSERYESDFGTVGDTSPVFQHYIEKDMLS